MSAAVEPRLFRFRPPATALPTAAVWALRRGFGPIAADAADAAAPPPAAAAADWAAKLGLVERIAARWPEAALAAEIGDAAADFAAAARRTAARNLALRELAAIAVREADERGISVLLLKGIALLEEIPQLDTRRPLADVDLLVEPAAARELSIALAAMGLEPATVHESSHHLPALYHPRLGTLELHVFLPGVGRAGQGAVTASDLLGAGRSHPARELAPARVPSHQILAAHAIAHALVQGAHSPAGYPLLRLAADLADLSAGRETLDRLVDRAAPWLAGAVSARELAAVSALGRDLAAGAVPAAGSDAGRILDHVVAAHLDPGYRRSLQVRALDAALRRRDWLKVRRGMVRPASLPRLFRIGWSWLSRRLRRGAAQGQ